MPILKWSTEKVSADFRNIDPDYALILAVKAVNYSTGPNGIVPSLLVFGIYPGSHLSAPHPGVAHQRERMDAMWRALQEMNDISSGRRVDTALRTKVPTVASSSIVLGAEVLGYKYSTVMTDQGQWTGPFIVYYPFGKHCFIKIHGTLREFSIDCVNIYQRDSEKQGEDRPVLSPPDLPDPSHTFVVDSLGSLDRLISELRRDVGTLRMEEDESIGVDAFFWSKHQEVHLIKPLPPQYPDNNTEYFRNAKYNEIEGLCSRIIWEEIELLTQPVSIFRNIR